MLLGLKHAVVSASEQCGTHAVHNRVWGPSQKLHTSFVAPVVAIVVMLGSRSTENRREK